MPSLRHSSAMLSSPRRPATTIRISSSAEYCRRVARRISRTRFSASSDSVSAFDLISAPCAVKMSPILSLPQSPHSVQLVLTRNSIGYVEGRGADVIEMSQLAARTNHPHVLQILPD